MAIEKATFGAGCFWGVEAKLNEMTGVLDTAVGYEGGTLEHPTFDAGRVSYERLLDGFFSLHDPTQLNRLGPDWGSQYRSVIFTHSESQASAARAKIAELGAAGTFHKPVVTQVQPSTGFWKAEEYHQKYLEKRGMVSCHI